MDSNPPTFRSVWHQAINAVDTLVIELIEANEHPPWSSSGGLKKRPYCTGTGSPLLPILLHGFAAAVVRLALLRRDRKRSRGSAASMAGIPSRSDGACAAK
jgi:hypothetical protein